MSGGTGDARRERSVGPEDGRRERGVGPEDDRREGGVGPDADARRRGSASAAEPPGHRVLPEGRERPESPEGTPSLAPSGDGAGDRRPGRLPTPLTSFIGREREVRRVLGMLGRSPLVTLTGPGGTGKTRLALEVARRVADGTGAPDAPVAPAARATTSDARATASDARATASDARDTVADDVFFVDLSGIREPELVLPGIARALGLAERPESPTLEALERELAGRRVLLVLDNFEQVASAAPRLTALLGRCDGIRALVTSRLALRVAGEQEFAVPPLDIPPPRGPSSPEELGRSAAVALFVERARAVLPDFSLDGESGEAVAEICRRLDGLPLAIEIAAARVKLLPPTAILERLDRALDLPGGSRDAPERHRTLRQAIDWSHDLLTPLERTCFRRLGVFAGGCSLEAAERVCSLVPSGSGPADEGPGARGGAREEPPSDLEVVPRRAVLDHLAGLVDHSLLRRADRDGEPRFEMLEMVREYALERLAAAGEERAVRAAHARRFVELAERAAAHLTGPEQAIWFDRLETEHDNLRQALAWAEESGDRELAFGLTAALWRFFLAHGHLREGFGLMERVLEGTDERTPLRARVLQGAATLAHNLGENRRARAYLLQSLAIYQELEDPRGTAEALNNLAWVGCEMSDFETAVALSEEAMRLHRQLGDRRGEALSLNNLGWVAAYRGEAARARELFSRSLELRRELGDQRGIAFGLANLAWVDGISGRVEEGRRHTDEALDTIRSLEDRVITAWILLQRVRLELRAGANERARELLEESGRHWKAGGNPSGTAVVLTVKGETALRRGDPEKALRILDEALGIWRRISCPWGEAFCECRRAGAFLSLGMGERAAASCAESIRIRRQLRDRLGTAESIESLARATLTGGPGDEDALREAAVLWSHARAIRDELGTPPPEAGARSRREVEDALAAGLGEDGYRAARAEGRELPPEPAFERALALARRLGPGGAEADGRG